MAERDLSGESEQPRDDAPARTDPPVGDPRAGDSVGRATQSTVFRAGASGTRPRIPTGWAQLQRTARRALSPEAWAYIAGGAGVESTAAENATALERWRIVPRVLRDVSQRDLSVELFGRRYPTPLLASPIGVLELVHADADLAIARAAAAHGIPSIISSQASVPMERIAAEGGGGPLWFQLYWSRSPELVESFLARAESIGAHAVTVTLDTAMLGWRPRDLDLAHLPFIHGRGIAQYTSDPVFQRLVRERMDARRRGELPPAPAAKVTARAIRTLLGLARRHPGSLGANLRSGVPRAAVETFLDVFSRTDLTWDDLAWLRGRTSLPILLKGVQHPDDARRALDAGVDGIVVSNHAGRQIDGAIGSADALPGVVDAVAGRMPVLFDSGVRGGADVVRALALGASAVAVGRAWVYGLAIAGEAGASEALRNVLAETDLVLGLSGHRTVADLSRDDLVAPGG